MILTGLTIILELDHSTSASNSNVLHDCNIIHFNNTSVDRRNNNESRHF